MRLDVLDVGSNAVHRVRHVGPAGRRELSSGGCHGARRDRRRTADAARRGRGALHVPRGTPLVRLVRGAAAGTRHRGRLSRLGSGRSLARLTGAAPSSAGLRVRRVLTDAGLLQLVAFISRMPSRDLAELEGVSPGRAHQLVAGALVAETAMRALRAGAPHVVAGVLLMQRPGPAEARGRRSR